VAHKQSRGERKFGCPQCNKMFLHRGGLKAHLVVHTTERPLKCPDCEKTFKHQQSFTQHILNHRDIRNFPCSICLQTFKTSSYRNAHVLNVHSCKDKEPSFQCPQCPKLFLTMNRLKVHVRLHRQGDARPFQCDTCHKRFKSSGNLKEHKETHGGQVHACGICGKRLHVIHVYALTR